MNLMLNNPPACKQKPLFKIEAVTKRFDGVIALDQVSFEVKQGELLSIIGPNGSGKTTLFNCITGFLRPEEGRIYYREKEITQLSPDKISLLGIGRTFQSVSIFPSLTVLENLLVSVQQHQEENNLKRILHTKDIRLLEEKAKEKAYDLLENVKLYELRDDLAENLVYGQRKLLEFICVLISDPSVIMLDEPAAGVSTLMVDEMKKSILDLSAEGKTVLLVEHNMGMVMDMSQRIIVLDHGKKIADGLPKDIRNNEQVQEAYFGT
jgi:ABC-type branched-subunit amino acid transport system ATPase component